MAKVKFGAIVTDISGKLGGHVFAKNRGGNYMRTKTTPLNPQSVRQMAVRAMFALISSAWSALTETARNSFRDKVVEYSTTNVFGDVKNPSGKALYQKLNQNLLNSGQNQISECPSPSSVPSPSLVSVAGAEGTQALVCTLGSDTTGAKIVVFATQPLSQGTKFVKNKLRQIGAFNGQGAGTLDILAEYTAKFGSVSEDENIYVGAKIVNSSGQDSPLQTVKAVISA